MLNRCFSKYLSVIIFLFWTSSHPINASSSDGYNNFLGSNSKELGELSIDIDGDGKVDALTDGLLLLRYMFGLSGNSLTSGVISNTATYTSSNDLISRISALGDTIDIDSNGDVDALTDGLMILRYLFGIDGSALVNNVIGANAERTSTNDIENHLQQLADIPSNESRQPNIILIISDDHGLDSSAQYSLNNDPPKTPNLDQLALNGIVFDNAWATPVCTTTRSTMITGKYGVNSGVLNVGDIIPADSVILQRHIKDDPSTSNYVSAVIGKWHLGGSSPQASHPNDMGVDYYAGNLRGSINDYESWPLTLNRQTNQTTTYHTTKTTDLAIDWIGAQTEPWFLWLAYVAPHSPFHLPPSSLHTQNLSGTEEDIATNPRPYYLAAIEAMDTEIGRLLSSLSQEERDNTTILFVGDNGTPRQVADRSIYANGSKGNLTEGGLAVPMIASGAGVSRQNVREDALISSTDFFATITNIAGSSQTSVEDSKSFKHLLTSNSSNHRDYLYSDFSGNNVSGWAVRNSFFKLISTDNGQELYNLASDPFENNNLINSDDGYADIVSELTAVADEIRQTDSGGNTATDITNKIFTNRSGNCNDYIASYSASATDIFRSVVFTGEVTISQIGNKCRLQSNGVPNHDFNDGNRSFPNNLSEQSQSYEITSTPTFASTNTQLSIGMDNGLMLNGIKIDLLAAACFGVGNGKTGCGDMSNPWRYDPMFPANGFAVDSHNAHVQPNGSYHYHATPNAMFSDDTAIESPVVGFAADGFPIFGFWFDDNGTVRKAKPSYRLKSGARTPVSGYSTPSGNYDGAYRQDYEFVRGLGDLDECNGMEVDGVYGYFITEDFPYIVGCFKGQIDPSFN